MIRARPLRRLHRSTHSVTAASGCEVFPSMDRIHLRSVLDHFCLFTFCFLEYSFDEIRVLIAHRQAFVLFERLRIGDVLDAPVILFDDLRDELDVGAKELLARIHLVDPRAMQRLVERDLQSGRVRT